MGQQIRRMITVFLVVSGTVSLLATGSASAATVRTTPAITYLCGYPMVGQHPIDITMRFTGPDTVPAGGTFTPTGFGGTLTFPPTLNGVLSAANYDGFRGRVTPPVTGTNVTPASATVTELKVPEQIAPYVPGPRTIDVVQDAGTGVPVFTAGTPGSASVLLGAKLVLALDIHKRDNSWTPWTFNCTVKSTNPAQDRVFGPSLPIT